MGLPLPVKAPPGPVPLVVEGLLRVQRSAQRWALLAVYASVLTGAAALALAYTDRLAWWLALPFFLAPLLPIAALTRVEEMRRLIEDQLREAAAAAVRDAGPP